MSESVFTEAFPGAQLPEASFGLAAGALYNQIEHLKYDAEGTLAVSPPRIELVATLAAARAEPSRLPSVRLEPSDIIHIAEGLYRQARSLDQSEPTLRNYVEGLAAGLQARSRRKLADALLTECFNRGGLQISSDKRVY
jgi:hypothetical protein